MKVPPRAWIVEYTRLGQQHEFITLERSRADSYAEQWRDAIIKPMYTTDQFEPEAKVREIGPQPAPLPETEHSTCESTDNSTCI